MEAHSWSKILGKPPALYVLLAFSAWWIVVIVSGQQAFSLLRWNFEATGQFGDSFGIISALMASMAAIFTYQTLVDTRDQAKRANEEYARQKDEAETARKSAEEDREKAKIKDIIQERAQNVRDAEQTYFRLLELRLSMLQEISVRHNDRVRKGSDAIDAIFEIMRFYPIGNETKGEQYVRLAESHSNELNHYYRLTYHIIGFAMEKFSKQKAYEMVRLLRAQLSNSELSMIALNCAYGGGVGEFKRRVEVFALLHNLNKQERSRYGFDSLFEPTAFERASHDGGKRRSKRKPSNDS